MPAAKMRMPKSGLQAETLSKKKKKAVKVVEDDEDVAPVVVRKAKKSDDIIFKESEVQQMCNHISGIVQIFRSKQKPRKQVDNEDDEEEEVAPQKKTKKAVVKKSKKAIRAEEEEEEDEDEVEEEEEEGEEEPAIKRKKTSASTEQKKKASKKQHDEEPQKKGKGKQKDGDEDKPKGPTPIHIVFNHRIWHEHGFNSLPNYYNPASQKKNPKFEFKSAVKILKAVRNLASKTQDIPKGDVDKLVECGLGWCTILAKFIEYGNMKLLWGGHDELASYLQAVVEKFQDGTISIENDSDESFQKILTIFPPPKWEFPMTAECLDVKPAVIAKPSISSATLMDENPADQAVMIDDAVASALASVPTIEEPTAMNPSTSSDASPVKKLKIKVPSPSPAPVASGSGVSASSPKKDTTSP